MAWAWRGLPALQTIRKSANAAAGPRRSSARMAVAFLSSQALMHASQLSVAGGGCGGAAATAFLGLATAPAAADDGGDAAAAAAAGADFFLAGDDFLVAGRGFLTGGIERS